jgi:hypothetical protein
MEAGKYALMFEGRAARLRLFYRKEYGWDMEIEGRPDAGPQLVKGIEDKALAKSLLLSGHRRGHWDLYDEDK